MDLKVFLIGVMFLGIITKDFMVICFDEHCPNVKTSLGSLRKRRHLAFPKGAAASISTSVVKTIMTHIPSGWYFVVEAELVYHLPEGNFIGILKRRRLHHRQKRDFWELVQNAFDERNLNGRACVLRTICEARNDLAVPGVSLVHDILRALFTAPMHDEEFVKEIDSTYDDLLTTDLCKKDNDCPFSILNFILDLNKQK